MRRWKETINIKPTLRDADKTFEEKRDEITAILKNSQWFKRAEQNGDSIFYLVDELGDTEDVGDFDSVLGWIYDEADGDSVWLGA